MSIVDDSHDSSQVNISQELPQVYVSVRTEVCWGQIAYFFELWHNGTIIHTYSFLGKEISGDRGVWLLHILKMAIDAAEDDERQQAGGAE